MLIKQSKLLLEKKGSIGEIIKLIGDMQELINYGEKSTDRGIKWRLRELKPAQSELFKLGIRLGADLASMRANSNLYVDHPVYGRLRY